MNSTQTFIDQEIAKLETTRAQQDAFVAFLKTLPSDLRIASALRLRSSSVGGHAEFLLDLEACDLHDAVAKLPPQRLRAKQHHWKSEPELLVMPEMAEDGDKTFPLYPTSKGVAWRWKSPEGHDVQVKAPGGIAPRGYSVIFGYHTDVLLRDVAPAENPLQPIPAYERQQAAADAAATYLKPIVEGVERAANAPVPKTLSRLATEHAGFEVEVMERDNRRQGVSVDNDMLRREYWVRVGKFLAPLVVHTPAAITPDGFDWYYPPGSLLADCDTLRTFKFAVSPAA